MSIKYQPLSSESPRNSNISDVSLESNIEESSERGSSSSSSSSRVSFGSFQEAPTLLEAWDIEFEKKYRGKDAGELIMSEMMGVDLDSTQHNAIRKLIKENNFKPSDWKTTNEDDPFSSDCNKDGTYKHCIFMGVHENGPVYLDQMGNLFDENVLDNNLQYVVPEKPNDFGFYEFKIHKPIKPVDTRRSSEIFRNNIDNMYVIDNMFANAEEHQQEEINSSESGASESLLEKWKREQTKNYDGNSNKKVTSDIMGIELTKKQHEVIGDLIENKNFEPHMWKEHKFPSNFTYVTLYLRSGKVVMGGCFDDHLTLEAVGRKYQTTIYLDKEGNFVDEQGNKEYSVGYDKPEPYHLYIFEKNIQGAVQLSPERNEYEKTLEKYPKTIELGKRILALVGSKFDTKTESHHNSINDENAYQYMFTDSSLVDLLQKESAVIKDIVQSFVKGNVLQNAVQKVDKKGRRDKIEDFKKALDDIGITNITHALIVPENNMEQDFGDWNDLEGLTNICEKLEIFLLQITSYIHTNTCRDGLQKYIPHNILPTSPKLTQCEQNKFFIYNQMYKMVAGLLDVFTDLKETHLPLPLTPVLKEELEEMEKILDILKHYEKYYIEHRESRSSYAKKGGKTQRKRKTRKFRKIKNKAKSHKKRLRIKSRKVR